jgi:hypothetical protein
MCSPGYVQAVAPGDLLAEQQVVNMLQSELDAARREVEALQGEAAAAAVLRNELASRCVHIFCVLLKSPSYGPG